MGRKGLERSASNVQLPRGMRAPATECADGPGDGNQHALRIFFPIAVRRRPEAARMGTAGGSSNRFQRIAVAVANFEAVSDGVFEKDGVIAGLVVHGAFDVLRAGLNGDFGDAPDAFRAFCPEGDPVFVRLMAGRFGDAEELGDSVCHGFELEPAFDFHSPGEAKSREERFVERSGCGEIWNAKVDVIEVAWHGRRGSARI